MNLSELIHLLQNVLNDHGDLPCRFQFHKKKFNLAFFTVTDLQGQKEFVFAVERIQKPVSASDHSLQEFHES